MLKRYIYYNENGSSANKRQLRWVLKILCSGLKNVECYLEAIKMSTQKQEKFRILQKHLVNTKQKTLAPNQESDTAGSK